MNQKTLTIPMDDTEQYHICIDESSVEPYTNAYPIGRKALQRSLEELLEQEAYHDDSQIEIYVLTSIKVSTIKTVEIITE